MHVQTKRICYITPGIFLESAEDKLIIFSYTLIFYRNKGPRILMAELNKENINTKQPSCYQNILFLHPDFFFLFQMQHAYIQVPKTFLTTMQNYLTTAQNTKMRSFTKFQLNRKLNYIEMFLGFPRHQTS